jgi:uncharacterized membrane protein
MAAKTDPMDRLKDAGSGLLKAAGEKALSTAGDRVRGLTDRLEGIADGGPIKKAAVEGAEAKMKGDSPIKGALKGLGSGVKDAVTGGSSGGGGGSAKATKSTNILETIDVGVPIDVAYNAWTEFDAFPSFMKKVENVDAEEETKLEWKAQIFWSHRTWEATILEQIPNERIVWRSKGEKGHVDGAVTFHEIGPNLTRIMVVLEYYPQGLFEKTGNIWRAQGRRARAELRHFKRHVMTRTILEPEEVEGWRGVIEDGEVVKSHEEVVEEEEAQSADEGDEGDEGDEEGAPEDEYDESEDEYEEPEDDAEEPEDAEESEDDEEYDDEDLEEEPEEEDEGDAEDEYEEPEDAEEEYEDEDLEEEEPEEESEDETDDESEGEPDDEYEEYEEPEEDEERRPRRRAS